jgi:uncharacterized spore protein YtfJ
MALEEVVKQVAQALEMEGNSKVVFGEPVKLESKTVIPVAQVRLGAGGGGVMPGGETSGLLKALISGGGGGGFDVRPVGFIHERDGEVVFTPIHLDVRNKPFLTEAASGLGRVIDTVTSVGTVVLRKKMQPMAH